MKRIQISLMAFALLCSLVTVSLPHSPKKGKAPAMNQQQELDSLQQKMLNSLRALAFNAQQVLYAARSKALENPLNETDSQVLLEISEVLVRIGGLGNQASLEEMADASYVLEAYLGELNRIVKQLEASGSGSNLSVATN